MFGISQNSFYFMLTVISLLLIATAVRLILRSRNPAKDDTELRQRIHSWWVIIGLLFFVLISGETLSIVFFFLSFLALKSRSCKKKA